MTLRRLVLLVLLSVLEERFGGDEAEEEEEDAPPADDAAAVPLAGALDDDPLDDGLSRFWLLFPTLFMVEIASAGLTGLTS
jgi:hypothetical protein